MSIMIQVRHIMCTRVIRRFRHPFVEKTLSRLDHFMKYGADCDLSVVTQEDHVIRCLCKRNKSKGKSTKQSIFFLLPYVVSSDPYRSSHVSEHRSIRTQNKTSYSPISNHKGPKNDIPRRAPQTGIRRDPNKRLKVSHRDPDLRQQW